MTPKNVRIYHLAKTKDLAETRDLAKTKDLVLFLTAVLDEHKKHKKPDADKGRD